MSSPSPLISLARAFVGVGRKRCTNPLVHVDGVLAGDNVRNGGTLGLAGLLLGLGRHLCIYKKRRKLVETLGKENSVANGEGVPQKDRRVLYL